MSSALPTSDNPRVFRPARSAGWLWLLVLLVLVLLPLVFLLQPGAVPEDERVAIWINLAIMVPLATFFLLTLVSLPRMRYELAEDALELSMRPLLRYRVPYAEITDVRTVTLTPSLWSSTRMPGLALWKVPFADIGSAFMVATRMSRDILLITAGSRRYGITPADEPAFLAALMPKLPAAPRPVDGGPEGEVA